jgi:hypothetical protein
MTSDVASIPLTFNAVDIQDFDGLFLEITQGLGDSPDVRGIDVTVPALAGQVIRPRKYHQRKIILSGFVRGTGALHDDRLASYRSNVRIMLGLFDATDAPADLVASLEDGSTATIAARTLSVLSSESIPSEFAYVSIELLAVEDWTYEEAGS